MKINYARTCTIPISSIVADSATATGLKWAAPAAGGKVLQVVYGSTTTQVSNSTDTFADTTLTATITPSSVTSKVLVLVSQNGIFRFSGNADTRIRLELFRGATAIGRIGTSLLATGTSLTQSGSASIGVLDTPATTSATTYKTQFYNVQNVASVDVQGSASERSTIVLMEIGA